MVIRWDCPNCESWATTVDDKTPMHNCAGLAGLLVPLTAHGTSRKLEVIERQDYVGAEQVQTDANGRPVMAVVTTRDDGQDCTVFAPTAHGKKER